MDWMQEPVQDILSLIPTIKANQIDIDPPEGRTFVLKTVDGYFVRWKQVLPGVRTSPNIRDAYHCNNLVIAASLALFWIRDCDVGHKIYVEAVRLSAVGEYTPPQKRWRSESTAEVANLKTKGVSA